ncbi:DJ-1/PfpI family protein [bacterium]|nr:MAG: DJ-1/PfpI family protein [bacterium]
MSAGKRNRLGIFYIISSLALIFIPLFSPLCGQEEGVKVKKAVMLISQNGFRDEELFEPRKALEESGIEVKVASTTLSEVSGVSGGKAKPDILLRDINPQEYDAIILVGGGASSQYWDDPVAHKLVREADRNQRIVAAICIAPVTLARAGILKNRQATVWDTEASQLEDKGASYIAKPVVKDGNIITASGPQAAREFADAIVKALIR